MTWWGHGPLPCKLSYIVATVYMRLNMVSAGGERLFQETEIIGIANIHSNR